jgi:hypothetical protein
MDLKHRFDDDVETLGRKGKKNKRYTPPQLVPKSQETANDMIPDAGMMTSVEPEKVDAVKQNEDSSTYMEKKPDEKLTENIAKEKDPIEIKEEPPLVEEVKKAIDPAGAENSVITSDAAGMESNPAMITQQEDVVAKHLKDLQEAEGIGQKIAGGVSQVVGQVGGVLSTVGLFAWENPVIFGGALLTAGALPIAIPLVASGIKKTVDYFEDVPQKMEQVKQDIQKLKDIKEQVEKKATEIKSKF